MNIRSNKQLIEYIARTTNPKFLFFWGHKKTGTSITKSCLSQWFPSKFEENGIVFATAEHYMMYQKAMLFNNEDTAVRILKSTHPNAAKKLGREVVGFNEKIWQEKRFEIVVNANKLKFGQNNALKDFLLSTGTRVLVEASPVDKIWGIGFAEDHEFATLPQKWKGLNLLGYALMEVRSTL